MILDTLFDILCILLERHTSKVCLLKSPGLSAVNKQQPPNMDFKKNTTAVEFSYQLKKVSKTTYFPHSKHPLLVIGLQHSQKKNPNKLKISTTQKQKYPYILHVKMLYRL